jgi:Tfp pilus assembly protein PilO
MSRRLLSTGKPQRTWLITGLVAAGSLAYVFLVFLPAQRSIQSLRSQIREREQQILHADTLVGPLHQATLRLASTREVSQQWKTAIPSQKQITEQYARLSVAAQEAGVAIERFDPQPPTEIQLLALHGVVVQFQGEFSQVFDFVRRVEAQPGTIWMPHFRVSGDGQTGNTLRGELTLTIFVDRADYAD